jgi:hypothetical protein
MESDICEKPNDDRAIWSICKKLENFLDEKKVNFASVEEVPESVCDSFLDNICPSDEDIKQVESQTCG